MPVNPIVFGCHLHHWRHFGHRCPWEIADFSIKIGPSVILRPEKKNDFLFQMGQDNHVREIRDNLIQASPYMKVDFHQLDLFHPKRPRVPT
jgi:hypothetical protein